MFNWSRMHRFTFYLNPLRHESFRCVLRVQLCGKLVLTLVWAEINGSVLAQNKLIHHTRVTDIKNDYGNGMSRFSHKWRWYGCHVIVPTDAWRQTCCSNPLCLADEKADCQSATLARNRAQVKPPASGIYATFHIKNNKNLSYNRGASATLKLFIPWGVCPFLLTSSCFFFLNDYFLIQCKFCGIMIDKFIKDLGGVVEAVPMPWIIPS